MNNLFRYDRLSTQTIQTFSCIYSITMRNSMSQFILCASVFWIELDFLKSSHMLWTVANVVLL